MLQKKEIPTPMYARWMRTQPQVDGDPLGEHDCIHQEEKIVIATEEIDMLRDKDGVPIVGPDGHPWYIQTYNSTGPNGKA